MSVRQYIGARYVPKIEGAWNNARNYEALSIVTYLNNSYTSKKSVPVGIDISDTDYWVLTGNYNAAFESRMTAAENSINLLNTIDQVDDVMIFVTDSYGGTAGNNPGDTTTLIDHLRSLFNRTTSNFIGLSYDGAGFCNDPGAGTFLAQFSTFTAGYAGDKNKVSHVIIAAGRNDVNYNTNVIITAENTFYTYVKTQYPNAKVIYAYIANGNNTSEGTKSNQIDVYNAYKAAPSFGGIYLNGCEFILHKNSLMYSDGVHPTTAGKYALAAGIYEAFNTGSVNVDGAFEYQDITPDAGITVNIGTLGLSEFVIDNKLNSAMRSASCAISVSPSASVTAHTSANIKIGNLDITTGYILAPYGSVNIPCSFTMNKDGGGTEVETGCIVIDANMDVYVRFVPATSYSINGIFINSVYLDSWYPLVYI